MYVPPAFAWDDPDGIATFLAEHPLALLCINGPDGPLAVHVPLVAVRDAAGSGPVVELIGHLARANPFWQAVTPGSGGSPAIAVFSGPDAYVSPSAYPSKQQHGKVVPTWNYEAVELRGTLTTEPDPDAMDRFIEAPTVMMEQGRARPWGVNDAPAAYLAAMKRGIVGVRLQVTGLSAKRKLSQNRDSADFDSVHADLASRDHAGARQIAAAMAELRS